MEAQLHKATQDEAAQFQVVLQPQYTNNPQNICEWVTTNALKVAVKTFRAPNASRSKPLITTISPACLQPG